MSITTAAGLDAYEDIEPLPLADLAPRIARVRVDITDEPTPMKKLHDALTKEFTLMLRRFNGACKTLIAFNLGEFGMILQLRRCDSKVDVALKVKKKIRTPAVGPGETMEVVGKMYAITHNALNLPTINYMVGERVCDNNLLVLQAVLDQAKENGGCINESMLNCPMRQHVAFNQPTVADMNYTMAMVDVAQELSELNEANALADTLVILQIKAEIEKMLAEMPVKTEMADVDPDPGMTAAQYKSEVEKKLTERPDAAGRSPHELAFLELREQMSKLRAAHVAQSKHKAD